jgi:hypothetical protein
LAGISEPLQDGTNDGHGKNRTTNGCGNVQSSIDVVTQFIASMVLAIAVSGACREQLSR